MALIMAMDTGLRAIALLTGAGMARTIMATTDTRMEGTGRKGTVLPTATVRHGDRP